VRQSSSTRSRDHHRPAAQGPEPSASPVGNTHAFAFVANDVSRNVSAIDLPQQIVAAPIRDPRVIASTALPADAKSQAVLKGKRFFNTGLGRWSLKGQGWGSCQSCHIDGLTDNVTWYFARGPRQSVSLDGTFASSDGADQRILNWTAIFDEVDDFELNTRGVSGGVGALVSAVSMPVPESGPHQPERCGVSCQQATALSRSTEESPPTTA
jgi:hypothetical protein